MVHFGSIHEKSFFLSVMSTNVFYDHDFLPATTKKERVQKRKESITGQFFCPYKAEELPYAPATHS